MSVISDTRFCQILNNMAIHKAKFKQLSRPTQCKLVEYIIANWRRRGGYPMSDTIEFKNVLSSVKEHVLNRRRTIRKSRCYTTWKREGGRYKIDTLTIEGPLVSCLDELSRIRSERCLSIICIDSYHNIYFNHCYNVISPLRTLQSDHFTPNTLPYVQCTLDGCYSTLIKTVVPNVAHLTANDFCSRLTFMAMFRYFRGYTITSDTYKNTYIIPGRPGYVRIDKGFILNGHYIAYALSKYVCNDVKKYIIGLL
jgi:hypothetical protein